MVAVGCDADLLEDLQPRLNARLDRVDECPVEIEYERTWILELGEFAQRRPRMITMTSSAWPSTITGKATNAKTAAIAAATFITAMVVERPGQPVR